MEDFSLTGVGVHVSALGARLRRVSCPNLSEYATRPRELVPEELHENSPTLIEDTAGESSVCFHHVADRKLLSHDDAVALGIVVTDLMCKMLALPTNLSV
jgi:hypothetical protein